MIAMMKVTKMDLVMGSPLSNNIQKFCSFFIFVFLISIPSFISVTSRDIRGVFVSEQQLKELTCLTNTLYLESRGEPEEGIRAVMSVIYNRKMHKGYPDSFCGIILQHKQFSAFNNNKELATKALKPIGAKDKQAYNLVSYVAYQAILGGFKPVLDRDVLFYTKTDVKNKWTARMKVVKIVSSHQFLKEI